MCVCMCVRVCAYVSVCAHASCVCGLEINVAYFTFLVLINIIFFLEKEAENRLAKKTL